MLMHVVVVGWCPRATLRCPIHYRSVIFAYYFLRERASTEDSIENRTEMRLALLLGTLCKAVFWKFGRVMPKYLISFKICTPSTHPSVIKLEFALFEMSNWRYFWNLHRVIKFDISCTFFKRRLRSPFSPPNKKGTFTGLALAQVRRPGKKNYHHKSSHYGVSSPSSSPSSAVVENRKSAPRINRHAYHLHEPGPTCRRPLALVI